MHILWRGGGKPSAKESFSDALRSGKISSILIIGDSISDGNGDAKWVFSMEERKKQGNRLIVETEDEEVFYENSLDGQGWVRFFRDYLKKNNLVDIFHNNAIGGKSAKWWNAHKVEGITQEYDAIFVMLGTNDRWDCESIEEFYNEYAEFLEYASSKCTYLTVLTPIPAFEEYGNTYNMDIRQIVDAVIALCTQNKYDYINCYDGLLEYAEIHNCSIDEYFFGSTHPSPSGYLAVWRMIARKLEINLDVGDCYEPYNITQVYSIGVNRNDISEYTLLTDMADGESVFPEGVSVYYTTNMYRLDIPYGGTIVTYRYADNNGYQIFKPMYYHHDFVRYFDTVNGIWTEWEITNREANFGED